MGVKLGGQQKKEEMACRARGTHGKNACQEGIEFEGKEYG